MDIYTHTCMITHLYMNIHIDSHEDIHRARTSLNLLDLMKSWGVWKAGNIKLEKVGMLGWAADRPQMMPQLRYLVTPRGDFFLGQRPSYRLL